MDSIISLRKLKDRYWFCNMFFLICSFCFIFNTEILSFEFSGSSKSIIQSSAGPSDSSTSVLPESLVSSVASMYAFSHNIGGTSYHGECYQINSTDPHKPIFNTGDIVMCQLMDIDTLYHYIIALSGFEAIDFHSNSDNRYFMSSSTSSQSITSSYSSSGNNTFNKPYAIINDYLNKNRKCYFCKHPISQHFEIETEVNGNDSEMAKTRFRFWQTSVRERALRVRDYTRSNPPGIIYSATRCNCQYIVDFILMNYVPRVSSCVSPDGTVVLPFKRNNDILYEYIHDHLTKYLYDPIYNSFFDYEYNYNSDYESFSNRIKNCIYYKNKSC